MDLSLFLYFPLFLNFHLQKGLCQNFTSSIRPNSKSFFKLKEGRKHHFSFDTKLVSQRHSKVAWFFFCFGFFHLLAVLSAEFVLSDVKYWIIFSVNLPFLIPQYISAHQFVYTFQLMLTDAGAVILKNYLLKIFYKKKLKIKPVFKKKKKKNVFRSTHCHLSWV